MESNFVDVLPVIFVALLLWLFGLSVSLYWIFKHYKKLTKGVKQANLISVLENVIESERKNKKDISDLYKQIRQVDKQAAVHIQKVGMIRFNPFAETGGDQSFSLALLDANDNGFILTALHTRDRTRVYSKPIKAAKATIRLSKEEEKALAEAIKRGQ